MHGDRADGRADRPLAADVVRDEDRGPPGVLQNAPHVGPHLHPQRRVEIRERFVQQQNVGLWRERWYDEITLQDLVDRSGVSASTILRRFGSKERILAAVMVAGPLGVVHGRDRVTVGDVEGAVRELVDHYEQVGDAVIRSLALEERIPAIGQAVRQGRTAHRAFCARVFSPWLPRRRGPMTANLASSSWPPTSIPGSCCAATTGSAGPRQPAPWASC